MKRSLFAAAAFIAVVFGSWGAQSARAQSFVQSCLAQASPGPYNPGNQSVWYPSCPGGVLSVSSGGGGGATPIPTPAGGLYPVNLTQVGGVAVALGQTTAANSIPVVLASGLGVQQPYGMTQAQTALPLSGDGALGAYFSTPPTLTNGQINPLALDASGNLLTNINAPLPAGTNTIGLIKIMGSSVTASVNNINADALSTGSGALTTQAAGYLYNGASWDRSRDAASSGNFLGVLATAANSAGATGIIACDKQTAVNISTATTTQVVAVSGATVPYICAYHLYIVSGTLPTIQFEQGTSTTCTSPTVMSGTFGGVAAAVGESFNEGSGTGAVLRGVASSGICIVSGGTTPNIQGWVDYANL